MEIRFVLPTDDLYQISNVYEQSWRYAYQGVVPQDYLDSIPVGRWAGYISRDRENSLVIVENDRIVGTSCFCKSRFAPYEAYGEIVSIYLLPEYMGKGYGAPLFQRTVEELRKAGYRHVLLWVLEDNHRARRFYEKSGFALSSETLKANIGGRELNEVMYVYQIR